MAIINQNLIANRWMINEQEGIDLLRNHPPYPCVCTPTAKLRDYGLLNLLITSNIMRICICSDSSLPTPLYDWGLLWMWGHSLDYEDVVWRQSRMCACGRGRIHKHNPRRINSNIKSIRGLGLCIKSGCLSNAQKLYEIYSVFGTNLDMSHHVCVRTTACRNY